MDRLESIALSAMKQSLRAWLPEISLFNSLIDLLEAFSGCCCLAAHEKVDADQKNMTFRASDAGRTLLLVGPEGGFSDSEIEMVLSKGGKLVSLGSHRLRAETAAVAFLSQFLS
jgi:16S rRNA (uracil1498-N3)-methyltransferase